MTRLRVYIRMLSDDAFEFKAQALNNDSRLKSAGIAALKFVGDKKYIVNGDFSQQLPTQENTEFPPTEDATKPVQRSEVHVFVRVLNDDSYELKAQALNRNPRLKNAGIAGLRYVGDKQFIVDGEFTPTIPTPGESLTTIQAETDASAPSPKTSLHVFIRMKRDDSYKLMADQLNEDSRLPEAGISDVRLVKGQKTRVAAVPSTDQVSHQPKLVPAPATKKKRSYWGCLLGGILLGVVGIGMIVAGYFIYNSFLPVQQLPTQTAAGVPSPSLTPQSQATPSRTPRPTHTPVVVVTETPDEVFIVVQQLYEDGYLPSTQGELYPLDDYTLELAETNAWEFGWGYDEVQNFAVWTEVDWENASPVNFPEKSGCGFVYRFQENGNGYIAILSNEEIVMDLCDDVSCRPIGTTRGTGRVQFDDPAHAELSLVVDENHAYVLVDGQFIGEYTLLTDRFREPGLIGYALLSGTNSDFGTRCEFSNTRLWVSNP